MDFLPDGRLVVIDINLNVNNRTGGYRKLSNIYIVSNLDAVKREDIKVQRLGDSIVEAVGVAVVNGKIYVAEKNALNEYTLPASGNTPTKRKIADIPHDSKGSVNFQEYPFGLLYRDGFFYTANAGAVRGGGLSFVDDPTQLDDPKSGGVLKIKADDGSSELLNGGFRGSNGLSWGPEGTLWVTDNQGAFLPSSKLIQVVPGRNYGHFNGPNGFNAIPESPPAVWMVQGQIGNSPTHPAFIQKGLYAGQFMVGDISRGGVKRTFIEKVGGEWQGCAFSFSGGFEAGIQKIIEGPQGELYLAGLGRGDVANWGWNGKLFGLQKLTPKAGATVFEMLAIRSRKDGMEIEFTQPVGGAAALAANYSVKAATMKPGPGYGEGNMQENHSLTIKSVKVSANKKSVFLELEGLEAKRVLVIRPNASVKSESGDSLRCPAGWYTLNAISPSAAFDPHVPVSSSIAGKAGQSPSALASRKIKVRVGAQGSTNIYVPFEGSHRLELKTLDGRALLSRSGTGARDYLFDRGQIPKGVYLLELRASGMILYRSLVL